jgi:hypothetical protein
MNCTNEIDVVTPIASVLERCPCCAAGGIITKVADQPKFGIRCTGCAVSVREVCDTPEAALTLWCKRRGTIAALGGKATRGKCSWRKRRSSRRNARLARKQKKLNWMRAKVDAMMPLIRAYREIEQAELDTLQAEDEAWFKEREHKIMADPVLRGMYELLLRKNSANTPS